jgi:hypothetical protein
MRSDRGSCMAARLDSVWQLWLARSKTFAPLALLILLAAPGLCAGSLDPSILGMFPKNVTEFGYADLNAAREFPWFPQFEAQVVPVSLYGFEQFLEAAQMQQSPVIEEVAWARIGPSNANYLGTAAPEPGSGQIVGIAAGHFDLGAIQSFLSTRQIPGTKIGDDVMYAAGTGSGANDVYFILSSDQTIAFGSLDGLNRLLRARTGAEENLFTNEKMMDQIGEVNGDCVFWGVFSAGGAQMAVEQLLPNVAKFPQGHDLIAKMKGVSIAVTAPSDIQLHFQAVAASSNDALLLSQLVQVGLLYKQQAKQSDSGLGGILSRARVLANGNRLDLSLEVDDDQVLGLIEHDTFRLPM